jgi:hypothetical protein
LTDNNIDADTNEGAADRHHDEVRATWSPPNPVDHWRRTILSLAGTVVLVAVLMLSLTSVVCGSTPI